MAYKIIVSPRAQKEIENAIDYYALYSVNAPVIFISALKEAFTTLETNPFFRVRYKNIRALKINKFPHSLYFIINEGNNTIRVLSCFHNKRHPNKRPGV
jgi:toxin ParE1/3/4